jgi:hypothetical protein
MGKSKRVFRWWVGWNVEKIERWLEAEESAGWSLSAVTSGGVVFTFAKNAPRKAAYRIDYQVNVKADYRQLLEDAGWSLVGVVAGWHFWRAQYLEVKPEIFTDTESLIDRNKRQMWLLALVFLIQLPSLNLTLKHATVRPIGALLAVQLLVAMTLGACLVRYLIANRRLRNRNSLDA